MQREKRTDFFMSLFVSSSHKAFQRTDKTDLNNLVRVKSFVLKVISVQIPIIGNFQPITNISRKGCDRRLNVADIIIDYVTVLIKIAIMHFHRVSSIGLINLQQMKVSVDLILGKDDG